MSPKLALLLAAGTAAVVLATGAAIAWATTDGVPHQAAPSQAGAMPRMHAGMDRGDVDRLIEICQRAMKEAGMPAAGEHMGQMERMMGGGMMDGGGMMGGGMMGGGGMMRP